MNSNFPHAVGVIRAVLESAAHDRATAVAHALDSARLLVDPLRSFGVVLHRTPDGGWCRVPRPLTDLEHQALAWDASCARARSLACDIERRLAGHAGPSGVRVDGDRVRVALRVDGPVAWARWRAYLGITVVGAGIRLHTVTGEGERGGVRVTVVAHGATTAPPSAVTGPQARPFRLGGATYDLAFPQRDAHGDVWYFQGWRTHDGMPLMSLDGRTERCSLANVAAHLGPLSPMRTVGRGAASDGDGALRTTSAPLSPPPSVMPTGPGPVPLSATSAAVPAAPGPGPSSAPSTAPPSTSPPAPSSAPLRGQIGPVG
ncbi:BN159_2729 family protein [Streptomyces sp. NBC_01092]|uniref:BN159_2729 family protein n=1 Tax=Streptomyces sp. NBC_01092 TaxID=2903748 RepID=UPI003863D271|nr:BN159_2729 family protein [Streptomyces sp. NBC_01092]